MGTKSVYEKNRIKCCYTGKVVNGREVILVSEVLNYVKALGFTICDFSVRNSVLSHNQLMKKLRERGILE